MTEKNTISCGLPENGALNTANQEAVRNRVPNGEINNKEAVSAKSVNGEANNRGTQAEKTEEEKRAAESTLPSAAIRALAEAETRRIAAKMAAHLAEQGDPAKTAKTAEKSETAAKDAKPKEYGGRRDGKEPTRFGDWEYKGRAVDF